MDTPKEGFAHIGRSVVIKGQLSGSEDLYVDGVVEGTIELQSNSLVIGPNGKVHANVSAKGVVVQGKLEGNIHATDRTELTKTAITIGDITTQRISIEDGASFRGKIDIQKEVAKASSAAGSASVVSAAGSGIAAGQNTSVTKN
jgi:cytoskeletal protein CcmA (bactofilin family)